MNGALSPAASLTVKRFRNAVAEARSARLDHRWDDFHRWRETAWNEHMRIVALSLTLPTPDTQQ
jgi:hypothetical protein